MRWSLNTKVSLAFLVAILLFVASTSMQISSIQAIRAEVDLQRTASEMYEKAGQLERSVGMFTTFPVQGRGRAFSWTLGKLRDLRVYAEIEGLVEAVDSMASDKAFPASLRPVTDELKNMLIDLVKSDRLLSRINGTTRDSDAWQSLDFSALQYDFQVYPRVVDQLLRAHDAKNRDHVRIIAPVVRVHLRSLIGGGQGEAKRGLNGFKRRLAELRDEMEIVLNERSQDTLQTTYLMNGVALVLALILFFAVLVGLRPVRSLTDGVRQMARGNLDAEIPVESNDEIGQLAREFNEMARALKKQQRALVRAERLAVVGKMAANVAHEIRNPLNAIALNLELIEDAIESGSPDEMQPLLTAVGKEVQRLTDVTEAYLRFSGLPQPHLEPVDLSSIIRDLVAFQSEEARQLGVAIQIEAPPSLPAHADPDQLRQALLNLVKNAIEATHDSGHVLVRLECDENLARVIVEDDGNGVEQHMLEQIFEPFVSTKKHGTGLGLALARRVAEAHGGSLVLLPTPAGRNGACFQFEIERADWEEQD